MQKTIEKLEKLHKSVQKLESILQEVWSHIDEIGEDEQFSELMDRARKHQKKGMKRDENLEGFSARLEEFDKFMGEIPEDGTSAADFEDAIAEMIEWIKNNK